MHKNPDRIYSIAMHSHQRPIKGTWHSQGFTLIELLVTISVAAVVLSIAAPNFLEMSKRNKLSAYSNDLIATINYARSEAVRRGVPISICKSNNGTACSGTWNDGWIVFVNTNGNAVVDAPAEVVLKRYDALISGYTIGTDAAFANDLTYRADGAATNIGVFAVCYNNEKVGAKAIAVTRLRPRMAPDTNGNRIPNHDAGDIASCASPGA